ncbi:MAG TPA: ABC transporter substrate-binding protein, partial [Spirochaetota bacterium]|nr:ABC transporter substrate-binding protein [Spirochaetota bacterium]
MNRFFIILMAIVSFSLSAEEKVSIRLQWLPQAQFAGYYVAKDKGFYQNNGLDVTVMNGGPDVNGLAEVGQGKVQFATAWLSTGIEFVTKGTPVVCVGQIFPKSMLVLVTKKKSGITSIKDINNRKVGTWSGVFMTPIKAMMKINDVKPIYIKMGFDVQPFIDDKFDMAGEITSAMLYNEYNLILSKGLKESDLLIFNPADFGANFPEDGIYTTKDILKNKPDVVKKFVTASIQGWKYAIDNPDEAVEILLKNQAVDKSHQMKMLKTISSSIKVGGTVSSSLNKKDYDFVYNTLKENEMLGKKEVT